MSKLQYSAVRSDYSCCQGCTERFAGNETTPKCHTTCAKYLAVREAHNKAAKEIQHQHYIESTARLISLEAKERMLLGNRHRKR